MIRRSFHLDPVPDLYDVRGVPILKFVFDPCIFMVPIHETWTILCACTLYDVLSDVL